jgi:hypothetical protein
MDERVHSHIQHLSVWSEVLPVAAAQTDLTALLSLSAISYIDLDSLLNKQTKNSCDMLAAVSSRLPEIISTLKILKNVVALAPLGDYVGAGIELAISICEMAQVRATV